MLLPFQNILLRNGLSYCKFNKVDTFLEIGLFFHLRRSKVLSFSSFCNPQAFVWVSYNNETLNSTTNNIREKKRDMFMSSGRERPFCSFVSLMRQSSGVHRVEVSIAGGRLRHLIFAKLKK